MKRKLMPWELITSTGAKNCMNSKSNSLKPHLLRLIKPSSLLNLTILTKRRRKIVNKLMVPNKLLRRSNLLMTKSSHGVHASFRNLTNNLMKTLEPIKTNQWPSNLRKSCRLSAASSSRSSWRRMMKTVVWSRPKISWMTLPPKTSLQRTCVCAHSQE